MSYLIRTPKSSPKNRYLLKDKRKQKRKHLHKEYSHNLHVKSMQIKILTCVLKYFSLFVLCTQYISLTVLYVNYFLLELRAQDVSSVSRYVHICWAH